MTEFTEVYPKILLAGEYSILLGSSALTLPMRNFSARFDFLNNALDIEMANESNKILKKLVSYFRTNDLIYKNVDVVSFKIDINDGLYFLSNIPSGCGLGSSGALCAAILKAYPIEKTIDDITGIEALRIKMLFAAMESFFHNTSSGLDPLASYLNRPLLIKDKKIAELSGVNLGNTHWFLIDSGFQRNTGTLVERFLQNCTDREYKSSIESNYKQHVNEVIDKMVEISIEPQKNTEFHANVLFNLLEGLSSLQFRYFEEMIPQTLHPAWQKGLETGSFYLKLLGAGGGGFFLGCTKQKKSAESTLASYGFPIIWLNL